MRFALIRCRRFFFFVFLLPLFIDEVSSSSAAAGSLLPASPRSWHQPRFASRSSASFAIDERTEDGNRRSSDELSKAEEEEEA